jgi:hypothetical protein
MNKKVLHILVGAIVSLNLLLNCTEAQIIPPESLFQIDSNTAALWRFNEISVDSVIDETGINNGSAIGTTIVDGKFGKARYFNGSTDYITVPHSFSLTNLSQITIEAWVYPTGFDLGCWNQNESIVFKGVETPPAIIDYALRIDRNVDTWCGSASNFTQLRFSGEFNGVSVFSEFWHEPNQWYYVAFTYDGNYLKLYVNGILEATSNYAPNLILPSTTYPLYINHHTWNYGYSSSQRIEGLIDEIRISNIARSVEEIAYYWDGIVDIDIKPGSYPNSINLKSKGVTPVAVLTNKFFNAKDIVIDSVVFAGANPLRGKYEDVDNDGGLDLILHFSTQSLQLTSTDTEAVLTGQLYSGTLIKGKDSVRIVTK